MATALRNKYGKEIVLPSYEEILSLEIPEEYGDVKSKADLMNIKTSVINNVGFYYYKAIFLTIQKPSQRQRL